MVTISKYGLEKDAVWEEKAESGKRVAISFFFFCFVNTPSYTVSKRSSLWSVERFYYSYKIIATTTAA